MDTNNTSSKDSSGGGLRAVDSAVAVLGGGPTVRSPAPRAAAISVKNAHITYPLSKTPVLRGLSMAVAEGTIYGLLGASGCGKTTLLTCIVGRRRLDDGTVRVLGLTPGTPGSGLPGPTVGYMPQELALHGAFTVSETFRFFGWIAGMTRTAVEQRTAQLLALLDIPFPHKLVGELSGGQQRRVSLGVALLARPPVLILDEPTVGVDPTLRQSIWDLLVAETKSGRTTVVITTHYIEEARQSDKVGLMRNGTLLDEDSPDGLLCRYGSDTMEDVFLKLSVRQHRMQQQQQQSEQQADGGALSIPMTTRTSSGGDSSKEALALADALASSLPTPTSGAARAVDVVDDPSLLRSKPIAKAGCHSNVAPCVWKMAVFTWRNKSVIGVLAGLPIVVSLLFAFAVGGEPRDLHLAVVNDDFARCGHGVPDFPQDCGAEVPRGLSCRYLRRLDEHMFVLDDYGDVGAALRAVRRGHAWGAMHFPANYSAAMAARSRDGRDADDATLDSGEVSVWMDMSNQQVSETIRASLSTSALDYYRDLQVGCKGNPDVKALPIHFNAPVYGSYKLYFPDFFAPAVILSILYNSNCIYTMAGFLDDKKDGFMERSIISGVNVLEVLGAHVLVDMVMMLMCTAITLVFTVGLLGFESDGSIWTVILFCVLNGFCGMFQGYFLASVFNKEMEAVFAGLGIYFPTLLLSGMLWPLEGMHPLLRYSSWLLPLNLATTGIRSVMHRGWGLAATDVANGLLSSLFWLAFFVVITLLTLRLKAK